MFWASPERPRFTAWNRDGCSFIQQKLVSGAGLRQPTVQALTRWTWKGPHLPHHCLSNEKFLCTKGSAHGTSPDKQSACSASLGIRVLARCHSLSLKVFIKKMFIFGQLFFQGQSSTPTSSVECVNNLLCGDERLFDRSSINTSHCAQRSLSHNRSIVSVQWLEWKEQTHFWITFHFFPCLFSPHLSLPLFLTVSCKSLCGIQTGKWFRTRNPHWC